MSRWVTAGSVLAVLGTAHAAVNARLLRRPVAPDRPQPTMPVRVSVLVPARDEAGRIGDCLSSLRAQECLEILVLDDGSTDDTAEVVARAAERDPRIRLLSGAPLPAGWLGKPHACAQLAEAADVRSAVFVFVDADVRVAAGAVSAAVGLLDSNGFDLVSPQPRQQAVTIAERLVQPLLAWSWLTTLPLRLAARSPRPSLSAANGQFLVIRRSAYQRAGGHAALRSAVLDDLALARAIKTAGGRTAIVDGSAWASCRMYRGWAEVRDGYAKSLWAAFGSQPGAAAVVGVLGLAYVLPAVAAVRGSRVGLFGYLAGVVGRVITARASGGRAWPDAVAHPVSVAVFAYLTGLSVVRRRRGVLRWKGRPVGP